jgi:hypothetical protein
MPPEIMKRYLEISSADRASHLPPIRGSTDENRNLKEDRLSAQEGLNWSKIKRSFV